LIFLSAAAFFLGYFAPREGLVTGSLAIEAEHNRPFSNDGFGVVWRF
jgi:hypothetical protein